MHVNTYREVCEWRLGSCRALTANVMAHSLTTIHKARSQFRCETSLQDTLDHGQLDNTAKMSQYSKIAANSPSRSSPSEIEVAINNALEDLQNNIPDMRSSLRPLQFVSAREVR